MSEAARDSKAPPSGVLTPLKDVAIWPRWTGFKTFELKQPGRRGIGKRCHLRLFDGKILPFRQVVFMMAVLRKVTADLVAAAEKTFPT